MNTETTYYATHPEQATARFMRTLRNLESVLYRQRTGQYTGRNTPADPTDYVKSLHALVLCSDAVAGMLDSNDKLAARYNRAERRAYGLYV